jgi:5-(carboxyamino)imidazole ribonucleotide synthase
VGKPAVLKTVRGGYDGKGQVMIGPDTTAETAWAELAGSDAEPVGILEAFVDYALEASVIVCRSADGRVDSYVPVENRHENHILARTVAPAGLSRETARLCTDVAQAVAHAIDLVGVMGVELFVTPDGEVLVNELAPRPHNSGHWTIDACPASQFEQFIRAVAGLPLATCDRHSDAVMDNLLGEDAARWLDYARDPEARLHLYGKAEARPGRKMGHVTWLKPRRG